VISPAGLAQGSVLAGEFRHCFLGTADPPPSAGPRRGHRCRMPPRHRSRRSYTFRLSQPSQLRQKFSDNSGSRYDNCYCG